MRRPLVALGALALVAGCSIGTPPDDPVDGSGAAVLESDVDVDTPELREAKANAGIADCAPGPREARADGGLPDLTLPCLGGGPDVPLRSLKGPMVVNLFAQWCEPCRDELPYYQRLHEEAGDKLQVVGIDYLDTQPDGAIELAAQTGVTYPLLADPGGALRQEFRVRGLPGVVLVDGEGKVANPGGRPTFTVIRSYAQLTDLVREHLRITL
jgi:thiol-disulfide isomerase/thioredoxin